MALTAATLALRPATSSRTWGFRRAEVLAACAQATILLGVGIYAAVEGIRRLYDPHEVSSTGLLVFGIVGLVGNIVSMMVLNAGRRDNLNMRAAFLEVVNDALGSVAVIISAIVISTTGWARIDAIAGMFIAALIVPRAITILREASHILLESTPKGLDLDDVRAHVLAVPHVQDIHDLHASTIASGLPVLTAHVVLDNECFTDGHAAEMLGHLQDCVAAHFEVSIEHTTFQLEPPGHANREHTAHM